ncbi:MAG TPA: RNA methyltransferase [Bryobacteraceae bacterium]|nr:RNA methyltransferase [Bryobacteraceae bacterium]
MTTARDRVRRISSRQNALVKDLRRAFQHGELVDGLCAVEGVRVIEEAIRSGLRFRAVFYSDSAENRMKKLLPQISSHAEVLALPDDVFASAVATESPQGIAALLRWPSFDLDGVLASAENPLLLGTMGIQDPGNLGTIIRSAEAFGAAAVLLGEKTVSQFNSKVIRASMGSCFRLATVKAAVSEIGSLKTRGKRIVATSSHKGNPIDQADLTGGLLIMVGSEGAGVPREYLELADEFIRVPHEQRVESLNAAVAASVILYEAQRQRITHHRDTEAQMKS